MKIMEKKDYLSELPMPKSQIENHELLQKEMQRIKEKKMMKKDQYKIELEAVPELSQQSNPESWQKLIDKSNTLLEHLTTKQINLELLQKFGKNVWQEKLVYGEQLKEDLNQMLEEKIASNNDINAKRKYKQQKLGSQMQGKQATIKGLLNKNQILELECLKLEKEVFKGRRKQLKVLKTTNGKVKEVTIG